MNDYLLDRFLFFNFKPDFIPGRGTDRNTDPQNVITQVLFGVNIQRKEYFKELTGRDDLAPYQWDIVETETGDVIQNRIERILEAVIWTFSIAKSGKQSDAQQRLKQLFGLAAISPTITQFVGSQCYSNSMVQGESVLKYILERMGLIASDNYAKNGGRHVGYEDKTGFAKTKKSNVRYQDYTLSDILDIYKNVTTPLDGTFHANHMDEDEPHVEIMWKCINCRNGVAHTGPNAAQYRERLKFLLYDFIMYVYFLREAIDARAARGEELYKNSKDEIDKLVAKNRSMKLNFVFGNDVNFDELSLDEMKPDKITVIDGKKNYSFTLQRCVKDYVLQTLQAGNNVNDSIKLNTRNFYDGAKVEVISDPLKPAPELNILAQDVSWFIPDGSFRKYIYEHKDALNFTDEIKTGMSVLMVLDEKHREAIISCLNNMVAQIQQLKPQDAEQPKVNLNKVICEQFSQLSASIQKVINSKYQDIEEAKKAEKEVIEDFNVQLDNRLKIVEDEVGRLKQEMAELRTGVNEQVETIRTDVEGIKTDVKEVKTISFRTRRMKYAMVAVGVLIALLIAAFAIGRINPRNLCAHYEWTASLSHFCGNRDIAYDYAVAQETAGNYETAATWYRKAINRYMSLVDENPEGECDRALRLTFMYMRGKGGSIDYSKASDYACKADRKDIDAYIKACQGEYAEVKSIANMMGDTDSKYIRLAKACIALFANEPKTEVAIYMTEIKFVVEQEDEATEEAYLLQYMVERFGVYDLTDSIKCIVTPSMLGARNDLVILDQKYNSIVAQRALGSFYESLNRLDEAVEYTLKAYKNGCTAIAPLLYNRVNRAMRSGMMEKPDYYEEIQRASRKGIGQDVQSTVFAVMNNVNHGDTGFGLNLTMMEKANSLSQKEGFPSVGLPYYSLRAMLFAEDIDSEKDIKPYISDSVANKELVASYYWGIKQLTDSGFGLENSEKFQKGIKILESCANQHFFDAQVALALLTFAQGDTLKGMKMLPEIEKGRYVRKMQMRYGTYSDQERGKMLFEFAKEYPFDIEGICMLFENQRWKDMDSEVLRELCRYGEIAIAYNLDYSEVYKAQLAYVMACLAEFKCRYAAVQNPPLNIEVDSFILEHSLKLETMDKYYDTFFLISEDYRKRFENTHNEVDKQHALAYMTLLLEAYIQENKTLIDDDVETYLAIYKHCEALYPELIKEGKIPELKDIVASHKEKGDNTHRSAGPFSGRLKAIYSNHTFDVNRMDEHVLDDLIFRRIYLK